MRWDIRERTTEIRHCKITEEATRKSPRQGIILTLRSDSSVVFHDKLLQQENNHQSRRSPVRIHAGRLRL